MKYSARFPAPPPVTGINICATCHESDLCAYDITRDGNFCSTECRDRYEPHSTKPSVVGAFNRRNEDTPIGLR